MNFLFLALLSGLQMHEWGVIVQNPTRLTGTVDQEQVAATAVSDSLMEFEDKAPVVYFHGDPCFIDLRISFPSMGYATAAAPSPDQGGLNSTYAVWEELELTSTPASGIELGWPECESSQIPSPIWRNVDALDIATDCCYDRFLYYECIPGSPGDLPFISQSGNQSIRMPYGEIPCIVLTCSAGSPMYGVFTLSEILTSIPKGLQFLDDPQVLKREIWRWADGVLYEDEFEAFWNTWESEFLENCTENVMIIYRVPDEILEGIAEISIVPSIETEVTMNRFILAELPYRTESHTETD